MIASMRAADYRNLLGWVRASGTVRRAGVEGTGSYGAALSRYLPAQGVDVFDVDRFERADRRRRGSPTRPMPRTRPGRC